MSYRGISSLEYPQKLVDGEPGSNCTSAPVMADSRVVFQGASACWRSRGEAGEEQNNKPSITQTCLKPQAPQPASLTCWRGCNPHRIPFRWLIYPTCSRATAHVALLLLLASHSAAVPSLPGAAPEQPGHSS